ncbi:MAG TPA: chromosomal replication initiator protein DnaA [Phycisphaerae bacterium]|nr:chromosomal replication initiator protein DnaA [Phycisphaerae bacterium]
MEEPVAEKVCTIRARVADRIGVNRYRTWFSDSTHLQLDGERLDVTVANAFVGKWIASNYLTHLIEVTRDVIGAEPRIEIRVDQSCPRPPPTRPVALHGAAPGPPLPAPPAAAAPAPRAPLARPTLRGELEAYVVGPANQLAFSVASAVVQQPGAAFKHVVIHGGCGLGKTHLLQGICNGLTRAHPELQWCYLSGEEFTNEFIYAVKAGRIDYFRARFRNVDLLVIDDLHFLANKTATQGEFLHTFNAIDASGKAVVLSCDCHPRSIATLSEPLVNRLSAAMIVRIDPPDFAMRREILRRRAAAMLCELPDDVLDYVARRITRNVRELEGALYKLAAYASLTREPLQLDLARRAVEDYVAAVRPPEPADIERIAAAHFGVTREALHSGSRDRTVTHARSVAMHLIRKHTRLSFPEIGRFFGNKQHSTVLMAVRRIQNLVDRNGAVSWKTPTGVREVPVRSLLDELEQRLLRDPEAPP